MNRATINKATINNATINKATIIKETIDKIKYDLEYAAAMDHSMLLYKFGEDVQIDFCTKNYKLFRTAPEKFYENLDTLLEELTNKAAEVESLELENACYQKTDDQNYENDDF